MEMENVLIAVYGSLRKGMGNWEWLLKDSSTFISEGVVSNYAMYSCGGFPACVPSDSAEDTVVVEVYSVDKEVLTGPLDSLEGYPQWYTRELVEVKTGDHLACKTWMYFWPDVDSAKDLPLVENGDWVAYRS